mmetsp:Transcript_13991/g.36019  ORF Transcript_13991/g.36019 Transcript_13991/m.36019 type:complete len:211 (-) Transcript_13991:263-895(-)
MVSGGLYSPTSSCSALRLSAMSCSRIEHATSGMNPPPTPRSAHSTSANCSGVNAVSAWSQINLSCKSVVPSCTFNLMVTSRDPSFMSDIVEYFSIWCPMASAISSAHESGSSSSLHNCAENVRGEMDLSLRSHKKWSLNLSPPFSTLIIMGTMSGSPFFGFSTPRTEPYDFWRRFLGFAVLLFLYIVRKASRAPASGGGTSSLCTDRVRR